MFTPWGLMRALLVEHFYLIIEVALFLSIVLYFRSLCSFIRFFDCCDGSRCEAAGKWNFLFAPVSLLRKRGRSPHEVHICVHGLFTTQLTPSTKIVDFHGLWTTFTKKRSFFHFSGQVSSMFFVSWLSHKFQSLHKFTCFSKSNFD